MKEKRLFDTSLSVVGRFPVGGQYILPIKSDEALVVRGAEVVRLPLVASAHPPSWTSRPLDTSLSVVQRISWGIIDT